ncbi:hypothetical protein [Okeania sp. SIO1I7]|uniref:hypothetical protein n=1 Tax=Okeania sp. SIO1I7 TaxID=2607772 RepID=UPI0013F84560|nr:hypothetical protein [Okeania sp. SIO1I7]NET24314.1 hypothetical protein [Okeania sp. SIO1I7]
MPCLSFIGLKKKEEERKKKEGKIFRCLSFNLSIFPHSNCNYYSEGRRKKEGGRRKEEEGRRKEEEGRRIKFALSEFYRTKEEGRRKEEKRGKNIPLSEF